MLWCCLSAQESADLVPELSERRVVMVSLWRISTKKNLQFWFDTIFEWFCKTCFNLWYSRDIRTKSGWLWYEYRVLRYIFAEPHSNSAITLAVANPWNQSTNTILYQNLFHFAFPGRIRHFFFNTYIQKMWNFYKLTIPFSNIRKCSSAYIMRCVIPIEDWTENQKYCHNYPVIMYVSNFLLAILAFKGPYSIQIMNTDSDLLSIFKSLVFLPF